MEGEEPQPPEVARKVEEVSELSIRIEGLSGTIQNKRGPEPVTSVNL